MLIYVSVVCILYLARWNHQHKIINLESISGLSKKNKSQKENFVLMTCCLQLFKIISNKNFLKNIFRLRHFYKNLENTKEIQPWVWVFYTNVRCAIIWMTIKIPSLCFQYSWCHSDYKGSASGEERALPWAISSSLKESSTDFNGFPRGKLFFSPLLSVFSALLSDLVAHNMLRNSMMVTQLKNWATPIFMVNLSKHRERNKDTSDFLNNCRLLEKCKKSLVVCWPLKFHCKET